MKLLLLIPGRRGPCCGGGGVTTAGGRAVDRRGGSGGRGGRSALLGPLLAAGAGVVRNASVVIVRRRCVVERRPAGAAVAAAGLRLRETRCGDCNRLHRLFWEHLTEQSVPFGRQGAAVFGISQQTLRSIGPNELGESRGAVGIVRRGIGRHSACARRRRASVLRTRRPFRRTTATCFHGRGPCRSCTVC